MNENKLPNKIKKSLDDSFFGHSLNFFKDGRFYIQGDVDESIPSNIIQPLVEEIERRSEFHNPKPLEFFINSNGGDLALCYEIIGLFKLANAKGIPVCTYVMSYAASAASLIAECGNMRYVTRRSYHLLHFARGWDYAHNPEMADRNTATMKFLQSELVEIYKEHTKIKDIEAKLLADNFMPTGGKQLIRLGLADQIL